MAGTATVTAREPRSMGSGGVSRPGAAGCRVTCSFGVAQHRCGERQRDRFAAADRALYRAERAGKNRVDLAPPVRSF
ncbi:MAG: hypothetical protein ACYDCH_10395 [Gaiellaceae bacterium]